MESRITVPEAGDRATVVAALVKHAHSITSDAALAYHGIRGVTDELSVTVGLLEALREQAIAEGVTAVFGPSPTDQDIKEAFDKIREDGGFNSAD